MFKGKRDFSSGTQKSTKPTDTSKHVHTLKKQRKHTRITKNFPQSTTTTSTDSITSQKSPYTRNFHSNTSMMIQNKASNMTSVSSVSTLSSTKTFKKLAIQTSSTQQFIQTLTSITKYQYSTNFLQSHFQSRSIPSDSSQTTQQSISSAFRTTSPTLFHRRRISLMTANETTLKFLNTAKNDVDFEYKDQINERSSHKLPFDQALAGCTQLKRSIRLAMFNNSPHLVSMFYNMPNAKKTRHDWVAMLCYLSSKNDQKQLFLMLDNFLVQVCNLPPLIQDRLGFLRTQDFSTQQQQMHQYRNETKLTKEAQKANELEFHLYQQDQHSDESNDYDTDEIDPDTGKIVQRVKKGSDSLELPSLTKEDELLQAHKWQHNRSADNSELDENGLQGYDENHDDLALSRNTRSERNKTRGEDFLSQFGHQDIRPIVEFSATGGSRAEIQGDGNIKLVIDVNQDTAFELDDDIDAFGAFDPELLHYETPEDEANAKKVQEEQKTQLLIHHEAEEQKRIKKLTETSFLGENQYHDDTIGSKKAQNVNGQNELDQLQQLLAFQQSEEPEVVDTVQEAMSILTKAPLDPSSMNLHNGTNANGSSTFSKDLQSVNTSAEERMRIHERDFLSRSRDNENVIITKPHVSGSFTDNSVEDAAFGTLLQQDPRGILNSYAISLILECLSGIGDHKQFLLQKKQLKNDPNDKILQNGQQNTQNAHNHENENATRLNKFSTQKVLDTLFASKKIIEMDQLSNTVDEITNDSNLDPVAKLRKNVELSLLQELLDDTPPISQNNTNNDGELDLFGDHDSRLDGFLDDAAFESRSLLFLKYSLENGLAVTSQCFDVVLRGTSLAIARDSYRFRVRKAIAEEKKKDLARLKMEDEELDQNGNDYYNDYGHDSDLSDDENAKSRKNRAQNDNETESEDEYGADDLIGVTSDRLDRKLYHQNLSRTRARRSRLSKLQEKVEKLGGRKKDNSLFGSSFLNKLSTKISGNDVPEVSATQRALDKAGREFNDSALYHRHQRILLQTQQVLDLMSIHQIYPNSGTWTHILRAHFFRLSNMPNQADKNICFREQVLPLYSQMLSTNSISSTSVITLATIAASCGQISLFEQFYQNALQLTQSGNLSPPSHQLIHAYRMIIHTDSFMKNNHPNYTTVSQIYDLLRDTLSHCDLSRLSPSLAHTMLTISRVVPPTDVSISTIQPLENFLTCAATLDSNDTLNLHKLRQLVPHLTSKQKKTLHQIHHYYQPLKKRTGTLTSTIFAANMLFSRNILVPTTSTLMKNNHSTSNTSSSIIKDNHSNTFTLAPMTNSSLSFSSYKQSLTILNKLGILSLDHHLDEGISTHMKNISVNDTNEGMAYSTLLSNLHPQLMKNKRPIDITDGTANEINVWVPDTSIILADFIGSTSLPTTTSLTLTSTSTSTQDTTLSRPAFDYDTLNEVIVAHVGSINHVTNLFVDFRHRYNHFIKHQTSLRNAQIMANGGKLNREQSAQLSLLDKQFRPDYDGFLTSEDLIEPLNLSDPIVQKQLIEACLTLLNIDITASHFIQKIDKEPHLAHIMKILHPTTKKEDKQINQNTDTAAVDTNTNGDFITGYEFSRWVTMFVGDMIGKGDIDGNVLMNRISDNYNEILVNSLKYNSMVDQNNIHGVAIQKMDMTPPKISTRHSIENALRLIWRSLHTDLTEWSSTTRITPYHVIANAQDNDSISIDLNQAVPMTESTISHLLSLYLSIPKSTTQSPAYTTQYSNYLDQANFGVKYAFQLLAHLDKSGCTITAQHLNTVLQFCHSPQDILTAFGAFSKFNALATTTATNGHIANSLRMLLLSFLNFDSPSLFKQWAFASTQTLSNISSQLHQQHIYYNELPSTFIGSTMTRLQHSLNNISTHNLSDHSHKIDPELVQYRQSVYSNPRHSLQLFDSQKQLPASSEDLDLQYFQSHSNIPLTSASKLTTLENNIGAVSAPHNIDNVNFFGKLGSTIRQGSFYDTLSPTDSSHFIPNVISIHNTNKSTSQILESLKINETEDTLLQYLSVFGNSFNNNISDMPLHRMCLDLYINNRIINLHEIDFAYTALQSTENINDFDNNLESISVYKPSSIRNRYSTMIVLDVDSASGNTTKDEHDDYDTMNSVFPQFNSWASSSETELDRYHQRSSLLTDLETDFEQSGKSTDIHKNSPAYHYSSISYNDDDDIVPIQTWATNSYSNYLYGDQTQTFSNGPLSLKNDPSTSTNSSTIHGLTYIKPRSNRFIQDSLGNVHRKYGHPNAMTAFEAMISFTAPSMMSTYFEFCKRINIRNYVKDPTFTLEKVIDEQGLEQGYDNDYDGMIEQKLTHDHGSFDYVHENIHTYQIQDFNVASQIRDLRINPEMHMKSTSNAHSLQYYDDIPMVPLNQLNTKAMLRQLIEKKRYHENYIYAPENINAGLEQDQHINTMLVRHVNPNPQIHDTLLPHLQSAIYYPEAQMPTIVPLAIYRQCISTSLNWLSQFGADLKRSYALMALWQIQSGLSLPFDLTKTLPKSIASQMSVELQHFVQDITLPVISTSTMSEAVHTTHNVANNYHAQLSSKLNFMQHNYNSYEYNHVYKPIHDAAHQENISISSKKTNSDTFLTTQLEHIIPGRMFTTPSYLDIDSPLLNELITLLNAYVVESAPDKYIPGGPNSQIAHKRTIIPQTLAQDLCSPSLIQDNTRIGSFLLEQDHHGYATRDFNPFKSQQSPVPLPIGFDQPAMHQKKDFIAAQLLQLWYNVGSAACPIDAKEFQYDEMWKLVNAPEMILTSNDQLKKHLSKSTHMFHSQAEHKPNTNDGNASNSDATLAIAPDLVLSTSITTTPDNTNALYQELTHQQFLNNVDSNLFVCSHHLDVLNSIMLNSLSVLPFSVVANREGNVLELDQLLGARR